MKLPVLMACAVAILSATTMKLHAFPFANLKLQTTVDTAVVAVGEAVAITVSVKHLTSDFEALGTATNGMVTIVVPDGSSSLTSSDCTVESANTMVCILPEMAVGESVELAATAVINREGYQQLTTTLTADDLFGGDQVESTALTVTSVNPDNSPVDLALDVRNSGGESYLGGYVYVSTVVKNVHEINTTHFPTVEIVVPEDLQYVPEDRCVENAGTAVCEVVALPPGAEATAVFAFIASSIVDELSIVASAASTQPDTAPQNNTATFVTSVVQQPVLCGASNPSCINGGDGENSTDPENSGTSQLETGQASSETQSTGGGVFPLLFVFAALLRRFRGSKRT
jgi:hypothetical protein